MNRSRNKKLISPHTKIGFLSLIIIFLFLHKSVQADILLTAVSISPQEVKAAAEKNFSVIITVKNNPAAKAIQLKTLYDSNLLTVTSVTTGSATLGWSIVYNTNVPGLITIGLYNLVPLATDPGGHDIVTINYKVKDFVSGHKTDCPLTINQFLFDEIALPTVSKKFQHIYNGAFHLIVPPTFYSLTTNLSGRGSIDPNTGRYRAGTQVTLKAIPFLDYEFTNWDGTVHGTTNPVTLTMDSNKNITAIFSPKRSQSFLRKKMNKGFIK